MLDEIGSPDLAREADDYYRQLHALDPDTDEEDAVYATKNEWRASLLESYRAFLDRVNEKMKRSSASLLEIGTIIVYRRF